jgi:hypothetical protein
MQSYSQRSAPRLIEAIFLGKDLIREPERKGSTKCERELILDAQEETSTDGPRAIQSDAENRKPRECRGGKRQTSGTRRG